eukprot:3564992-Amphidinium_carterae.1
MLVSRNIRTSVLSSWYVFRREWFSRRRASTEGGQRLSKVAMRIDSGILSSTPLASFLRSYERTCSSHFSRAERSADTLEALPGLRMLRSIARFLWE